MTAPAPPPDVLAAFGLPASSASRLLPGGQRRAFAVEGLVFKPVDQPAEHAWVCETFEAWPVDADVRVPEPLRSLDGSWSAGGWGVHRFVPGEGVRMAAEPGLVRAASDAFHDVLADRDRAAFLDERDDVWSFGDRVAFDGLAPVGDAVTVALVDEARAAYESIGSPSQMVHGDIGGNVLGVVDGRPAVIDFPPYWRPAGFALAVAAVDALCWEGVGPAVLDAWSAVSDWEQLLLRAFVYRVATVGRTEALGTAAMTPEAHARRVRSVLDLLT